MNKFNLSKRRNKDGFTLAELLIVVAIIAVLVLVSIPIFTSSLDEAKLSTCLANRRSLYAEMATSHLAKSTDENFATLEAAFKYFYTDGHSTEEYVCPAGGTFSWEASSTGTGGKIICSYHDGNGETGGGGETVDPTVFPGNLKIVEYNWKEEATNGTGTVSNSGGIFKAGANGNYYFVSGNTYCPHDFKLGNLDSQQLVGVYKLITNEIIVYNKGDVKSIERGSIIYYEGTYYLGTANVASQQDPSVTTANLVVLPSN